jgi:flagellar hook-basal body complex protein FliE
MAAPIAPVVLANPATSVQAPALFAPKDQADGSTFQSVFKSAVDTVDGAQKQANQAIEDFLSGNTEDVHSTVLATQRADLTFELFMQVRNKMISAYQEIMRMQV